MHQDTFLLLFSVLYPQHGAICQEAAGGEKSFYDVLAIKSTPRIIKQEDERNLPRSIGGNRI